MHDPIDYPALAANLLLVVMCVLAEVFDEPPVPLPSLEWMEE
jgi:hypothetical protein